MQTPDDITTQSSSELAKSGEEDTETGASETQVSETQVSETRAPVRGVVNGDLPSGSSSSKPTDRSPGTGTRRRVYRALLAVHRWLTFALGTVLVLVAGSGALLVYQYEIDNYLNEGQYGATPGDVGWEAVKETVEAGHPDMHLGILWWPRWNVPVYEAGLYEGDEYTKTVAVDPGTGEIISGEAGPNRIMDTVNSFHTTLLAGETGYWLVLASTIAAIFLTVTGLYLWWPRLNRIVAAFKVRTRSLYALNFDLHQVSGTVTAPLVLIMSLTGLALAFPDVTTSALHALTGEEQPEEVYWSAVKSQPAPSGTTERDIDYNALIQRAHNEVPGAETFYVTFPQAPRDPIHIRLQTGIDPKPFGITSRLAFDRYTGELIQVVDPRRNQTQAKKIDNWVGPLHFGRIGGHWGRAIYIGACLVLIGLFAGGLYIWIAKRSMHRR